MLEYTVFAVLSVAVVVAGRSQAIAKQLGTGPSGPRARCAVNSATDRSPI